MKWSKVANEVARSVHLLGRLLTIPYAWVAGIAKRMIK